VTKDFDANNDAASVTDSVNSSVPDTPMINSNPQWSKYGHTDRSTTHYDPKTGCTIGAEATTLANYDQCLEEMDDEMEFTNVGVGI
jgi:hypothetical protein